MSSIEIRHLALDYAVKTAQSGEPTSYIVNAAKAFEAYLADPETKLSHPTVTQEQLREAEERFARAVREGEPVRVLDDEPAPPPSRNGGTYTVTLRADTTHLADDLEEAAARLLTAANAVRGGAS